MRLRTILLTVLCAFSCIAFAQEISIIPQPAQMTVGKGAFLLQGKVVICYPADKEIKNVVNNFADDIKAATGVKLKKSSFKKDKLFGLEVDKCGKKGVAHIVLRLDNSLGDEAYNLSVRDGLIKITAAKPAGFFYAFQTIKQLLPANVMAGVYDASVTEWRIPAVEISDEPRFAWRGFMLDEGRHFYGKNEIKKILDVMAAYKMNRFHWHLTEDQGWRIEIKKYPKLTEIGAWRDSKVCGWGDVKPDGIRYGGFYTQKEAREIVEYAKERFIEIIPEVDIPGHSQAAVASYPEFLACDPEKPHEVWLWQGVSSDVINVSNPKAVQFAKDVIDELTDIFPFEYIHLGGDECPTYKWEQNSDCQALLKEIGSKNYRDLQINFYYQLKEHIAAKPAARQRKLIFWNEVLHGNTASLGKDITIMAWVGADRAAKEAATRGMNTILSPQIPYYINRKQSNLPTEPHSQGYGTETVEAVYNYIPMKGVPAELQSKYMGVQANFWTEWVETADHVQYLMLPRLAAVAEAGWTPQALRDYKNFEQRLQGEALYYRLKGVNYGKHVFK
ncbi:MAG: beta-N-acetylhexosaminidase [Bacteroidaceae bacterium]|nr:beta-N-acetylhexosaminidase [Bacteroidaceae bacterium]